MATEEEIRQELLRKAAEEQERIAAEERERELTEETRRLYEETRRDLEKHVQETKEAFEDMVKFREEMSKRVSEAEQRRFNEEWERSFSRWTGMASGAVREVMQRSMVRSLDSQTVGQLAPGLGEMGHTMGTMLGGAIGMAMGGPAGAILGKAIGAPIIDMIAMQAEGYNMLGARVARQAYGGGRGMGKDFEKIGQDYRLMVNQVVRETGATADAVGAAFDALSKVNIGFEEGGKDLAQYALAADRILNLRPGRTLQMETDLVRKYGESAEQAKDLTRDLIDAMAYYTVEQQRTGSALMGTFSAGDTLANTLDQITASARGTGASLDSLNGLAIMFVQTVAGAGMMRPDEIGESGGRAISGLLPSPQGTPAAETKRSGITRMILSRSNAGMNLIKRIEGDAPANMSDFSKKTMFGGLSSMYFSRQGASRAEPYRWTAAMLEGLNFEGDEQVKTWALLNEMGGKFDSKDIIALSKLQDELKSRGVFEAKDSAKAMKQMMREKAKDPEYAEVIARWRKFMDEAKRQGDAQASTMDKIADTMAKLSVQFNSTFWTQARDKIAEVFGLEPKASMMSIVGAAATPGGIKNFTGSLADTFTNQGPAILAPLAGGPTGWPIQGESNVSRQELHVSPDMQSRLSDEATANQSGLQTTGSN